MGIISCQRDALVSFALWRGCSLQGLVGFVVIYTESLGLGFEIRGLGLRVVAS